jgi:EpsI family protein
MDPKIAVATGADVIANRAYRNESGQTIFLHTGMFRDPAEGVYHSPMNCYRSNGWNKRTEDRENVQVSEGLTFAVSLVVWEKEGERILVAYWYQLGDHFVYDRFGLGSKIRWEMLGYSKWPVLLKVMAWIPLERREEERTVLLKFVEDVAKWVNQPEHQQYFAQWNSP